MCDKLLPVNFSTQNYNMNIHVRVVDNCNGFTVKNRGNTICFINGDPLIPGESKAFMLNRNEDYKGRIDLKFVPQVPPVVPAINSAWVTQKFYMFPETRNNLL
jgi:hypothetical protein